MRYLRVAAKKRIAFALPLIVAGFVFAQPCEGDSGVFESTGNLVTARYDHTATLLPDGKVLVAGGTGPGSIDCELYDPASGTWTATAKLLEFRLRHTATLLPNGKVLVAGGEEFPFYLASAELYDPETRTWTAAGGLNVARFYHTATMLPNGKVLVVGGLAIEFGYGGYSIRQAELYDPVSGTWTATGSLATARFRHTATLLTNGKVLVTGGYNEVLGGGPNALDSAELYDPITEMWSSTGDLLFARGNHTATLLPDGKVLVAGGFYQGSITSTELYDSESETWTPTDDLNFARGAHTATLLPDNKVLVAGGLYNGVLASAELYDLRSGTWTSTGEMLTARSYDTATLLPNGKVLVAGGSNGEAALQRAELYTEPPKAPNLLNISTRMNIQTGDNAMIGGFIVTEIDPKTVIVRGIGPSLGLPDSLADPIIEVHGSSGELLAMNDNWKDATTRQQIIGSGLAPTNDLESALWGIINPGSYTVVVRGNNGGTGLGLFEVYDLDSAAGARLANVSTRGLVQTGNDILIGGFISGAGAEGGMATVLVRGLGPSISGVGALHDPTLELRDGSGTLVDSNDNWKVRSDGSSQQAEIEATTIPPNNDLESAILTTVGAGSYTAIVRGKDGGIGLGLVEVYRLQ